MTRSDDFPLDPEIADTLEAIDATLAGDPVDPRRADVAELALLLAADRPVIDPAFATVIDESVERRFAAPPPAERKRGRWWVWAPAGAVAASLAVAVVIVVGGGGGQPSFQATPNFSAVKASPPVPPSPRGARAAKAPSSGSTDLARSLQSANAPAHAAASAAPTPAPPQYAPLAQNAASQPLQPPSNGRKVVQGAQLSLSTSPRRVDQVAQELFDVVGQQKGIVKSSTVTATGGRGGYAQFELSVPSSNVPQTMAALSSLAYANVASRTDSTQDVTNQYDVDQRHLANARALKTSLLKQLANALTQAQIDSLTTRIHDTDAAISSDEATLHGLQHQIGYSQIYVTINAGALPVPVHTSSGFTIGKAAHDAGRVLTVAAGVILIGLAALLPLALLAALVWWLWRTLRRHRRLQALDLY